MIAALSLHQMLKKYHKSFGTGYFKMTDERVVMLTVCHILYRYLFQLLVSSKIKKRKPHSTLFKTT